MILSLLFTLLVGVWIGWNIRAAGCTCGSDCNCPCGCEDDDCTNCN